MTRLVAWLLWRANAHPPTLYRAEFYALKDRLLRRYGTCVGEDLQHLRRACWGALGTAGCRGRGCRRCGGSGVYEEVWVRLERWTLGGRVFHRPIGVGAPPWPGRPVIEGLIAHADVDPVVAREAALWLALGFDRRLFWRLLRSSRVCRRTWRPLTALQRVVMPVALWLDRLVPRRCVTCGRPFVRPFARGLWFACQQCSPPPKRAAFEAVGRAVTDEDEGPFETLRRTP